MPAQSQAVAIPGPFSPADRQAILAWSARRPLNFQAHIETGYAEFTEIAEIGCRRTDTQLYAIVPNGTGVTLDLFEENRSVDFATAEEALAYVLDQEA